jgi:hypothetical protein
MEGRQMKIVRSVLALVLACAYLSGVVGAQRRTVTRRTTTTTRRTTTATTAQRTTARRTTTRANAPTNATDARMTGVFRLDARASADAAEIARRVSASLPPDQQQRVADDLAARLNPPPQIAIQRRGRIFDIASTRAPRITFDADGQTHTEQATDGHTVRTRAAAYGDSLMVSSRGSSDDEFSVNFDAIEDGRRLRVTRRIYEPELSQPVVVQSLYERVSQVARFDIYGEPVPSSVAETADNNPPPLWQQQQRQSPAPTTTTQPRGRTPQQQQPPVIRRNEPPPAYDTGFYVGDNTRFTGTLNEDLSTERTREGDPFTLTVREPAPFAGATIQGRVARVDRGGAIAGRAGITLAFERITLRDGRSADFAGYVEDVRAAGNGDVRVDNESRGGNVESNNSQSDRMMQRTVDGAGARLDSVYAQGRDNLSLPRGTEISLRSSRR